MLLIPFFWDTRQPGWIKFGVFLCSAGREIWSVDDNSTDDEITNLLTENGFPVSNISRENTATFVEIDYKNINLDDFYLWSDVDPKTSEHDVWRIYSIPKSLWSCKVFKENFWKTSDILPISSGFSELE